MEVISTNIGKPQKINWHGEEIKTGIYKYSVPLPIFLGNEDVKNDHVVDRRHHGGIDKACYLYSSDHYKFWQNLYPDLDIPWGMFGENLTIEGLQETQVNIGDIFQIGETIVQVTQPRQPCYKLGIRFGTQKIIKQFVDSGFAGVYVRVLQEGEVKTGDKVLVIDKKDSISVKKVFELLYTSEIRSEEMNFKKAIRDPHIAESCRKDLLRRISPK